MAAIRMTEASHRGPYSQWKPDNTPPCSKYHVGQKCRDGLRETEPGSPHLSTCCPSPLDRSGWGLPGLWVCMLSPLTMIFNPWENPPCIPGPGSPSCHPAVGLWKPSPPPADRTLQSQLRCEIKCHDCSRHHLPFPSTHCKPRGCSLP